jgi:hypothetical protein
MTHRAGPAARPGLLRYAIVAIVVIPALAFVVITALGQATGGAP